MRGRKPIPLSLHKARGSYRPARHATAAGQPQPTTGIPPCPAPPRQSGEAQNTWQSESCWPKQNPNAGRSCRVDMLRRRLERMLEGEVKLRETGLVIKTPAGFPAISPFFDCPRGRRGTPKVERRS